MIRTLIRAIVLVLCIFLLVMFLQRLVAQGEGVKAQPVQNQDMPMQALPVSDTPAIPVAEADIADNLDGGSISDPVWAKAMQGYSEFQEKYPLNSKLMRFLASAQAPKIMAIGCVDSRADLNVLLQADPGEIFGVRNIANMVPDYETDSGHHATSAALEYGINVLKVEHLILLGHSSCGGIKGLLTGIKGDTFITNWVSQMKSILPANYDPNQNQNVSYAVVDEYAKKALQKSYENCMKYPFVKDAVDKGTVYGVDGKKKLVIHVWFFDINTATIWMFDKKTEQWGELSKKALKAFLQSRSKASVQSRR